MLPRLKFDQLLLQLTEATIARYSCRITLLILLAQITSSIKLLEIPCLAPSRSVGYNWHHASRTALAPPLYREIHIVQKLKTIYWSFSSSRYIWGFDQSTPFPTYCTRERNEMSPEAFFARWTPRPLEYVGHDPRLTFSTDDELRSDFVQHE